MVHCFCFSLWTLDTGAHSRSLSTAKKELVSGGQDGQALLVVSFVRLV
jgi:hypothetical protein